MGTSLSFLVVDDEVLVQRALGRLLRRFGSCTAVGSIAAAREALKCGWDGLLLDVRLGDGSGLDLLSEWREQGISTPAVILTGKISSVIVNRAAALGARMVAKPHGGAELASFISDTLQKKTSDPALAGSEIARLRWGLSDRETEIVRFHLRGQSRDDYLRRTGVSSNTLKTQITKILEKTGCATVFDLAVRLLNRP